MKKILTVLMAAILVMALAACAQPAGGKARADRESVEYGCGRGGSEGKTGLTMSALPEGAADASYSVLEEDKIAQVIFTWNGDEYTFRMAPERRRTLRECMWNLIPRKKCHGKIIRIPSAILKARKA